MGFDSSVIAGRRRKVRLQAREGGGASRRPPPRMDSAVRASMVHGTRENKGNKGKQWKTVEAVENSGTGATAGATQLALQLVGQTISAPYNRGGCMSALPFFRRERSLRRER